jgi:hypothetical protein
MSSLFVQRPLHLDPVSLGEESTKFGASTQLIDNEQTPKLMKKVSKNKVCECNLTLVLPTRRLAIGFANLG